MIKKPIHKKGDKLNPENDHYSLFRVNYLPWCYLTEKETKLKDSEVKLCTD